MTSASWMHEAGHQKLVLCDDPEGREMGGGSGWGRHMYTCGQFMLIYGKKKSQYCKLIIPQLKEINYLKK